jgi:hypothetical protein
MARTSRNSHGNLKSINIRDEESAIRYIDAFAGTINSSPAANGAYSKAVNNGGWTNPSGPFGLTNQGLIKSAVWSVSILSSRAKNGDAEAREIIASLEPILHGAQDRTVAAPAVVIESNSQPAEVA